MQGGTTASDFKRTHVCFIIFSVSDRNSFDGVKGYHALASRLRELDDCKIVFIANKTDCTWEVTREEIDDLSKNLNCDYYEISCKNNTGIKEAIEGSLRYVIKALNLPAEGDGKKTKKDKGSKKCMLL